MGATNPQTQSSAEPAATLTATGSGETAEQALARARLAAQAKRLREADGICADVLAASPDHPAALALQGIIAGMAGNLVCPSELALPCHVSDGRGARRRAGVNPAGPEQS
jgi:hypothetical protein